MNEEKVKEYIDLIDELVYGTEDAGMGLLDCLDPYYKGCWDEELNKLEKLKMEING